MEATMSQSQSAHYWSLCLWSQLFVVQGHVKVTVNPFEACVVHSVEVVLFVQSHITGLPQDVLNSPMGPMLVQMLQPGLEAQLGNATASGVSIPAATPATGAPTTSAAPQQASTPNTTTNNSSNGAQSSTKGLKNGSGASRKKYKATLEEHFKKIMEGGETDANKAAVEAVKRVSALVREGKVEPPEPVSA